MKVESYLPPEFKSASKVLTRFMNSNVIHKKTQKLSNDMWFRTDSKTFIKKTPKIREIPSGSGWRWNQAKKRYTFFHEKLNSDVELMKLVPRKYPNSTLKSLPKLKLWRATVLDDSNPCTAYWCEKGADSDESFDLVNLQIEDFSFLAPFVDDATRFELWPSSVSENNIIDSSLIDDIFSSTFDSQCFDTFLNEIFS